MVDKTNSNPIRDIVASRIDGMTRMAFGEDVTPDHQVTRGAIREALLRKLIGELLPSGTSARSGFIVSKNGHISKQLDLIIVADRLIPPLLLADDTAIVPIEAALGVVEVKTTIDKAGIDQVNEQSKFAQENPAMIAHSPGKPGIIIPFYLIGFKITPQAGTAQTWMGEGPTYPWVRGICAIGKYTLIRNAGTGELKPVQPSDDQVFSETLAFLAMIINETSKAEALRNVWPEAFARYISDQGYPPLETKTSI